MDCEQLAPLYEEYVLGTLDDSERQELEAHLRDHCPRCAPGVAQARGVISQLAYLAPPAQPSEMLRTKIMDTVQASAGTPRAPVAASAPRPERAIFPAWAWAAAAVLALITGYSIRQMGSQSTQLATLRKQMNLAIMQNRSLQNELERDRMVASVMLSPDSMPLKLAPKDQAMPMVHAYLHPHMGVAVTADQMPAVPPARTLQLWFIPKKGQPVSVAIFRPDAQGLVSVIAPFNMPRTEIAALAVTDEPAGGSPQPTSSPAWVGQVN
jgi:anti-sigma-K factor RskA